jgi:hypothetical protein
MLFRSRHDGVVDRFLLIQPRPVLGLKPRWRMLPRVTPRRLFIGEAKQSAHVSLIELLLVLCLKVVADVSDVEACASALHLQINPIEIAKAYIGSARLTRTSIAP